MAKLTFVGLQTLKFHQPLFPVFGFFKTGADAANLLEASSSSLILYAIEPETQVLLQPESGAELPACLSAFQTSSAEFQTVLQSMALAGMPKPDLHLHSVQSEMEGGAVKWKVASQEKACLKASVEKPSEENGRFPPPELTRLSPYLDIQSRPTTLSKGPSSS